MNSGQPAWAFQGQPVTLCAFSLQGEGLWCLDNLHNSPGPIGIDKRLHFASFVKIAFLGPVPFAFVVGLHPFDSLNYLGQIELPNVGLTWVLGVGEEWLEIFVVDFAVHAVEDSMGDNSNEKLPQIVDSVSDQIQQIC